MLPAQRLRTILALAIPIIGGMLSQNILNLVDTYMVAGLGNDALAAVGLASFAGFIFHLLDHYSGFMPDIFFQFVQKHFFGFIYTNTGYSF